jgi:hypothetical protein
VDEKLHLIQTRVTAMAKKASILETACGVTGVPGTWHSSSPFTMNSMLGQAKNGRQVVPVLQGAFLRDASLEQSESRTTPGLPIP